MDSWARAWWPEKYRSLQILEDHHDWSNEAWTRVLLLLEYHQPGFALKGDNDKLLMELENTTKILLTTSSHNQELYRHISSMAFRDEDQRMDGINRNVIFTDRAQARPSSDSSNSSMDMKAPHGVHTLHRKNLSRHHLRMKLIQGKITPPKTAIIADLDDIEDLDMQEPEGGIQAMTSIKDDTPGWLPKVKGISTSSLEPEVSPEKTQLCRALVSKEVMVSVGKNLFKKKTILVPETFKRSAMEESMMDTMRPRRPMNLRPSHRRIQQRMKL